VVAVAEDAHQLGGGVGEACSAAADWSSMWKMRLSM